MKDLNRVQLIGHLGQDPEVTYTATSTARTAQLGADHRARVRRCPPHPSIRT